jgi:hypothetical protein
MDEEARRRASGRRARLRSFALVVGAAGAIAAARRLRRSSGAVRAAGLDAFEDAPCFLEAAAAHHADPE